MSTLNSPAPPIPKTNIPAGSHWVDLTKPDTVVVLDQPDGQRCAALGGIMAARMKFLGAKAVVVAGAGRVRDINELNGLGFCVGFLDSVLIFDRNSDGHIRSGGERRQPWVPELKRSHMPLTYRFQ